MIYFEFQTSHCQANLNSSLNKLSVFLGEL